MSKPLITALVLAAIAIIATIGYLTLAMSIIVYRWMFGG